MAKNSGTYNILMYSHDTYGLGHIRRTMAIAANLKAANINILILTGSPIAGRFSFPEQIDFVRIPGMIKTTNDEYQPLSIKINARQALDIRKSIITATAKTFKPQVFIVDKEPMGLRREVLPTLRWLRRCRPETRTILGLRDIMDDAQTVREDWKAKRIYKVLDELYTEIWVYGIQNFYDPIKQYGISPAISKKIAFTGYIPRLNYSDRQVQRFRADFGLAAEEKLVVVTTGGGGDGLPVIDTFLTMLEERKGRTPFSSIIITGPFMPKQHRKSIFKRSHKLGIKTFHFHRPMEKILSAADLVISMGGYNTLCEILSQKRLSLVIPRETPRKEQLIRAQVFKAQHLVDFIPWHDLSTQRLWQKVNRLLEEPQPYQTAIAGFAFTGIEVMRRQLGVY